MASFLSTRAKEKRYPFRDTVFLSFGGVIRCELGSRALCAREPGHMLHSKIGKLAYQAKSESIFAKGEYLGGTPFGMPFFFLLVASSDANWVLAALCAKEPGHILHSKIGKLAYQAKSESIFAKGEYLGGIPFGMLFSSLL